MLLCRLSAIAESHRLKRHVTTLLIQDGILKSGAPEPRGFIESCNTEYAWNFRPRRGIDCSAITNEAFQNITVADFPETAIPNTLKELGWTSEKLFAAYKEYGQIVVDYNEFISADRDIALLSAVLRGLTGVREVRLVNFGDNARKKRVHATVKIRIWQPKPEIRGRGLSIFLRAAALTTLPSLSTLVLEGDSFFDQGDDFATLDPSVIEASLPALRGLTSLSLPMRTDWLAGVKSDGTRAWFGRLRREHLAALLLGGLPHLQHLRIYTDPTKERGTLELSTIMDAISSDQFKSIDLEYCFLTLDSVESFLRRHSNTLKIINLNNIALIGGHFETLFTLVHDITKLEDMVISGTLVELSRRSTSYDTPYTYGDDIPKMKARRDEARKAIARFATRQIDHFPRELLDIDSSLVDDIYNPNVSTELGVIAESSDPNAGYESEENLTWDQLEL